MAPTSIIEQFNVLKDFAAGLDPGAPARLMHQLFLERGKEALGHRIVPAISLAAHAADDSMLRQQLLVLLAGILDAAVRMVDQSARWLTVRQRHLEGIQREPALQTLTHRPADHPAREQVQDYRQI